MATQIEQLRIKFNGMSTAQKKTFINNLKTQLQVKNNAEYSALLNECIKTYNAEVRGGGSNIKIDVGSLLDGIDDGNISKGKNKVTLISVKIWMLIAAVANILWQLFVPVVQDNHFYFGSIPTRTWSDKETYPQMLQYTSLKDDISIVVFYSIIVLLGISAIIIISSKWKTKLLFSIITISQCIAIILFGYALFAYAGSYDIVRFEFWVVLLLTLATLALAIIGIKRAND